MMEAPEDLPVVGADAKTIKYFYSKRNELVPPISLTSPPSGRQILSIADSTHAFNCNELYEQGSFYEINHDKLPPKSPIQLKAIRVVMVAEATMLNVTVSFPSTLALRSYFTTDHMVDFPELDERFVMSTNQAGRILCWLIPPALLEAGTNLKSFWLLNPASLATELPLVESHKEDDHTTPVISIGTSVLSHNCAKVVGWGIRRKAKYIGRHCGSTAEQKLVQSRGRRKRTQEITKNHDNKKTKKEKGVDGRETKKPKAEQAVEEKCTRGSKDRWSTERYKTAEKRLLEIMREKKAELGTPVLRQALRDEARKHIGDTGLLDHLLKHMAGKTVSNGTERFRRRHNSEGAMEYWLEPAELAEIRREAGINDSFWVTPPGWKLGDSLFPGTCGSDCKLAIADLKQQVASQLTRCDEQQNSLKKLEKEAREIKVESEQVIGAWQDKCQNLLEQKTKQEAELVALFDYMRGIKEEVKLLKEKQKPEKKEPSIREQQTIRNEGSIIIAKNIENEVSGAKKAARRSGFTICRPQGTFLWPSMVTTPGLVNSLSPRAQGVMVPATSVHLTNNISCASELEQQQNRMVFPVSRPPSASSSTASTAPKLQFLPTLGLESEVVTVPQLMLLQRAASPKNLRAPQYNCIMPCVQRTLSQAREKNSRSVAVSLVTSYNKIRTIRYFDKALPSNLGYKN